MAIRMAQEMKMNIDYEDLPMVDKPLGWIDRETRRRIWWSCFNMVGNPSPASPRLADRSFCDTGPLHLGRRGPPLHDRRAGLPAVAAGGRDHLGAHALVLCRRRRVGPLFQLAPAADPLHQHAPLHAAAAGIAAAGPQRAQRGADRHPRQGAAVRQPGPPQQQPRRRGRSAGHGHRHGPGLPRGALGQQLHDRLGARHPRRQPEELVPLPAPGAHAPAPVGLPLQPAHVDGGLPAHHVPRRARDPAPALVPLPLRAPAHPAVRDRRGDAQRPAQRAHRQHLPPPGRARPPAHPRAAAAAQQPGLADAHLARRVHHLGRARGQDPRGGHRAQPVPEPLLGLRGLLHVPHGRRAHHQRRLPVRHQQRRPDRGLGRRRRARAPLHQGPRAGPAPHDAVLVPGGALPRGPRAPHARQRPGQGVRRGGGGREAVRRGARARVPRRGRRGVRHPRRRRGHAAAVARSARRPGAQGQQRRIPRPRGTRPHGPVRPGQPAQRARQELERDGPRLPDRLGGGDRRAAPAMGCRHAALVVPRRDADQPAVARVRGGGEGAAQDQRQGGGCAERLSGGIIFIFGFFFRSVQRQRACGFLRVWDAAWE
ncbi:hypothetical protein DFJ74DRAFT_471237 [Hyaloraphidium curvatum]|nr:hypothetical protein DFJ74DRAFT_471237 [Hyaloraphidium curvatum]